MDSMYFGKSKIGNMNTDKLSFGEIGGVGQLVYNQIRFADYEWEGDNVKPLLKPVIDENNPPKLNPRDGMTGQDILVSLCELARRIDSYEEKQPYTELILQWCKENMQPYALDTLYEYMSDERFDISGYDAEIAAKDGIFSLEDFMLDLEKLYNAARFRNALNGVYYAEEDQAYNLFKVGRYFESLPVFEKYKFVGEQTSQQAVFENEPYDDIGALRARLLDCFPDFRLRLRIDKKTDRITFCADIQSVFDIAWYTLARMLTEEPAPQNFGKADELKNEVGWREGVMANCCNCGRFFIQYVRHQRYCDREECQKARNAKNQREFRKRRAEKKARA